MIYENFPYRRRGKPLRHDFADKAVAVDGEMIDVIGNLSMAEEGIRDALSRPARGTVIAVAHRLSTLRNVDRIVTLQTETSSQMANPSACCGRMGRTERLSQRNSTASQGARRERLQHVGPTDCWARCPKDARATSRPKRGHRAAGLIVPELRAHAKYVLRLIGRLMITPKFMASGRTCVAPRLASRPSSVWVSISGQRREAGGAVHARRQR